MLGLNAAPLRAHELIPTIVDIEIAEDGATTLALSVNLEAMIAGIGPQHDDTDNAPQADQYEGFRILPPAELQVVFGATERALHEELILDADGLRLGLIDGEALIPEVGDITTARTTRLTYHADLPAGTARLGWQYPAEFGATVLRLRRAGGEAPFYAELLTPGERVDIELAENAPRASAGQTLLRYIKLGFDHILPKGLDHVLFIIGLFLLSTRLRPLVVQVTTFTLAHSVTLAMGLLGWITIPGSIVEPLIALSIIFVAVENIFTQQLHRWRQIIVFGFGLLHGLGFAGVLRELTVSSGQFTASLIGFNLGVELGQLTVVVLCYVAVGHWFGQRDWYHARIVIPVSVIIALIAGYWFFERVGVIA